MEPTTASGRTLSAVLDALGGPQGPLNLDAAARDDLMAFWYFAQNTAPVVTARRLFPNRPKGYVSATRDLGAYASNKATAIRCREAGKIESAGVYETICERIYQGLPRFARW